MGSERILMLKLLGDTSSLDKAVSKSNKGLTGFGKTVSRWGTAILADLAITGVEKLTDALGDAWTGFREGEQAAGQLGTTWKNLGLDGSKLGDTIDEISAGAKRLGIDDTESIMAFNKALQNTGGKPQEAMRRLRIAQDLVANGSAPNLTSAMKLIAQAGKGSARVVDGFGLKSKTAGGRIKELGEKVKGAAKKKAALDPLGTLFNAINEDLEGIVGSLSQGDIEGALGSIGQIGADISSTWSKLYEPVSAVLDKLLGGERYGPGGEKIGSTFGDISAAIGGFLDKVSQAADTILPKLQEGFNNLGAVWDALQPHVQNAVDAIQPLIDIASNAGAGTLGFVLDAVNGALSAIAALLKGDFSGAFTAVGETVGKLGTDLNTMFSGLPAKLTDEWLPAIGTAAGEIGKEILNKVLESPGLIASWLGSILTGEEGIVGKLGGAVQTIKDEAIKIGKGIYDGVVQWVTSLPGKLIGLIRDGVNGIIDVWNQLDFAIPKFDIPAIDIGFPSTGNGDLDKLLPRIKGGPWGVFSGSGDLIPDIPKLAQGGIVKRRRGGTLALLGEGQYDERVTPLDGRSDRPTVINHITVHVHAPVGANLAQAGQQVAAALQAYQRNGGAAHVKRAVNG